MKSDFLLNSKTARDLYFYAKDLPIIDYHNHLSVADISENKRFFDIYDLWIAPDPYKHRAMRMCAVAEKYITGDAPKEEKFQKWCETIPKLMGNPLYHWSVMELEAIFNITEIPNGKNARKIYALCNKYLKEQNVSVDTFMRKFNVKFASPCVSLTDDISMFKDDESLAPSLRGDDIVQLSAELIRRLEDLTSIKVTDLEALKSAIKIRLDYFYDCGCRFSDHALDNGFVFYDDDGKNEERFRLLRENQLYGEECERLSSWILTFLGGEYAKRGFTMQLHIGAQRYTSTRLRNIVGPAGGFAGIGNSVDIVSLTRFLDALDLGEYGIPKTVLFTLNPADNALISVLSGSYSKDNLPGLITQGPAWWWCDHKYGITEMLENIASFGVLSNFVGMTTDSRSFLSFVRHDYFRRILCDWIGEKAEGGEFFCGIDELKNLIYQICYKNAEDAIGGVKL